MHFSFDPYKGLGVHVKDQPTDDDFGEFCIKTEL